VHPDGPAHAAGLRVGDVILQYDNQTPTDERALLRIIAKSTIGQTVPITVQRANHDETLRVTPIAWPDPETTSAPGTVARPNILVPSNLGLSLSALTPDLRARNGLLMQQAGVVVDGVAAGTDAFDRGVVAGDVILRVQDTDVGSPQQVQAAVDAARAEHKAFILVLVLPKVQQTPGPHWMALRVSGS
jgi:serine protease Do